MKDLKTRGIWIDEWRGLSLFMSISSYLSLLHSFVTSIASDIPLKLEVHPFDFHQATWGKTASHQVSKNTKRLNQFPACWGYQPPRLVTTSPLRFSHKDNTSHNSNVQFYLVGILEILFLSDLWQTNLKNVHNINQSSSWPVNQSNNSNHSNRWLL